MSKIEGPWSFIYWHARHRQLWFGRDAMGRHSLLWSQPNDDVGLIVTSATSRQELPTCKELPATGIFVASLIDSNLAIKLYPWNTTCMDNMEAIYSPTDYPTNLEVCKNTKLFSPYPPCNLEIPQGNDNFLLTVNNLIASPNRTSAEMLYFLLQDEEISERVNMFYHALTASVDVRCKTQPQFCKQCVSIKNNF